MPVSLVVDISHLDPGDLRAFPHLVDAVKRITPVWAKQQIRQDFTNELLAVAEKLEAASQFVTRPDFRDFLRGRAAAFRTNSFHDSDMEWVRCVGTPIELIIGPFEESEKLDGAKEFEGTLGVVLPRQQAVVARYARLARSFESELAQNYGFTARHTATPITIMDVVVVGGGALGYTAMASKLPNDEDIRATLGSKTTLMANYIRAKFEKITRLLALRVLGVELNPEMFLQLIIGHELSHGMAFRFQREHFGHLAYSLEELKAEVFGVLFMYFLANHRILMWEDAQNAAAACIADSLREIRVDPEEMHAEGALMRCNWALRIGALRFERRQIGLDSDRLTDAFRTLGEKLYVLSQTRSLEAAKSFVEEWGGAPRGLRSIVESVEGLPVDIDPIFQV